MNCAKIPFKTKQEAEIYFRRQKASKRNTIKSKLRFYECPHCGCWHMTSMSKATSKMLKKKLKQLGIEAGQTWENQNGDTIEIIEPPSTIEDLGRWLTYFRLVK